MRTSDIKRFLSSELPRMKYALGIDYEIETSIERLGDVRQREVVMDVLRDCRHRSCLIRIDPARIYSIPDLKRKLLHALCHILHGDFDLPMWMLQKDDRLNPDLHEGFLFAAERVVGNILGVFGSLGLDWDSILKLSDTRLKRNGWIKIKNGS